MERAPACSPQQPGPSKRPGPAEALPGRALDERKRLPSYGAGLVLLPCEGISPSSDPTVLVSRTPGILGWL